MKRLSIFITALLVMFIFANKSNAQQVNVTSKAKKAFSAKFPNAQNVNWGKESPQVFEAEFTLNGKHMSANFDEQGHWKETETPISNNKIPSAVTKSLLKHHHKLADLKQAYKVAQPGRTVYELEVQVNKENEKGENEANEENENESGENGEHEGNGAIHELVFTSHGKLIHSGTEEAD